MSDPAETEMDNTLPPVAIPNDTPWYARLVLDNWLRIKNTLVAWMAAVGAIVPLLYENADLLKGLVSDKAYHYLTVAYMLFMWWNVIRNNRGSQKPPVRP